MSFPNFENLGRHRSISRGRSRSRSFSQHPGRSLSRGPPMDGYEDDDDEYDFGNDLVDHGFRDEPYDGDEMYRNEGFHGGSHRGGAYGRYSEPMMPGGYPRGYDEQYDIYDRGSHRSPSMRRRRSSYSEEDMFMANSRRGQSPMPMNMPRDPYYGKDQQHAMMGQNSMALVPFNNNMQQQPSLSHRRSSVSFVSPPHIIQPQLDVFSRGPGSSMVVKFRKRGSLSSGVNLAEAQSRSLRLVKRDSYTPYMLHLNQRSGFYLFIQTAGYPNGTYDVPVETHGGRISLSTIARRISRACVHYYEVNRIPVVWDRMVLHEIREIAIGVWQPMLTAR